MKKIIFCAAGLACTILVGYWYASAQSSNAIPDPRPRRFHQASNLPDLSGLVWLDGNRFLAVHDAKVEDEIGNPRVSLIELPANSKGVRWLDRTPKFHELPSNDLESAARIPGTQDVLLVESGDSLGDVGFQRIFKARVIGNSVHIVATAQWPVPINNVEASAVAALGPLFVFLFAERAQNLSSTELRWALFDPATLRFGSFASVTFANPNPAAFNRPLVAMDVDNDGQIYVAAAFDAEAAGLRDPDNGPFASAVYRIGVVTESLDIPTVQLFESPLLEGSMDGFKVESIAIREDAEHGFQIFVGLDDENYGATLRLLPEPQQDVSHRCTVGTHTPLCSVWSKRKLANRRCCGSSRNTAEAVIRGFTGEQKVAIDLQTRPAFALRSPRERQKEPTRDEREDMVLLRAAHARQ